VKQTLDSWSAANAIQVNWNKSAVIQIRVDKRTPARRDTHLHGFPVAKEYNYLGCLIDDDLKLDAATAKKKQLEKRLNHAQWLLSSSMLDGSTRYHTWQTLFKGRLWYSLVLMSKHSDRVKTWLKGFLYRAMKAYFGIATNTATEKTFTEVMGCDSETVWQREVEKLDKRLARQGPAAPIEEGPPAPDHWIRFKQLTKHNTSALLKWWLGCRYRGFRSLTQHCTCGNENN
jgi:hypothetical protein